MKCLALSRIVYGDDHWELARSHVMLAKAYLDLHSKYFSVNVYNHSVFVSTNEKITCIYLGFLAEDTIVFVWNFRI